MQEPWVIGLAVFGLLVLWLLWQAIENTLFGGLLVLIFGALQHGWKALKKTSRPKP